MFENWSRERRIRKTLRAVSRQRVAIVLQPGGAWFIENGLPDSDDRDAALATCHMRGWVEVLRAPVPCGRLGDDLDVEKAMNTARLGILYRLTEAGWAVIHRSQGWIVATFLVAACALIATILDLMLIAARH